MHVNPIKKTSKIHEAKIVDVKGKKEKSTIMIEYFNSSLFFQKDLKIWNLKSFKVFGRNTDLNSHRLQKSSAILYIFHMIMVLLKEFAPL